MAGQGEPGDDDAVEGPTLDRPALSIRLQAVIEKELWTGRIAFDSDDERVEFDDRVALTVSELSATSELAQAFGTEQALASELATLGPTLRRSARRWTLVALGLWVGIFGVLVLVGLPAEILFGLIPVLGLVLGSLSTHRLLRAGRLVAIDLRQRIDEMLRTEIGRLAFDLHAFEPKPSALEDVEIATAAAVATRVVSRPAVLEIPAMREVRSHVTRPGGAVLGIAGERGSGKSTLIRAACEGTGDEEPIVGVFVSAPTAPQVEAFMRLVVLKICEAVPGFASREVRSRRVHQMTLRWGATILGGVSVLVGAAYLLEAYETGLRWPATVAWCAIVGGGLLLVATTGERMGWPAHVRVLRGLYAAWRQRRTELDVLRVTVSDEAERSRKEAATKADHDARRTRYRYRERVDLERLRVRARNEARRLHHDLRFVETLTSTKEVGLGWRGATLGWGADRSAAAIPLTSADVATRLEQLVGYLRDATYDVVVGIDELDRLEAGEETDRFLNGIKQLFVIDDCSFLVSLSDSARAHFARHGVDVMGVLDSSFDEVVDVGALDRHGARHLVRRRGEVRMSDTQVLLCLALSGGRPRELLRQVRALAATRTPVGTTTTAAAADSLVERRWHRLRDGTVDAITTWERSRSRSAVLLALTGLPLAAAAGLGQPAVDPRWPRREEAGLLLQGLVAEAQVLWTIGQVFGTTGGRGDLPPPPGIGEALAEVLRDVNDDPAVGLRALAAVRRSLGLEPLGP